MESAGDQVAGRRAWPGVVTGSLVRADGVIAATLVQEGLIAEREPKPQ